MTVTASQSSANAAAMYEKDLASRGMGIAVEVDRAGSATATMTVTREMLNGFSVCHGGYLFALADTAFAFACNGYAEVTVAASGSIEFLRPAHEGEVLFATAEERRRGRRTGIYDVTVTDQDGGVVALFRGRSFSTRDRHPEFPQSDT